MTGLSRNIKYWMTYIVKSSASVLAMIIGIVAVSAFFDGSDFMITFTEQLPMYLLMMCMMIVVVFGFTNITVIYPVTISFGSRRSTSIVGMALSTHICTVVLAGLALASALYTRPNMKQTVALLWPALIGLFCLLMFLGNMVAVLSNRFGRVAGMIFYIIFILAVTIGTIMFLDAELLDKLITMAMISPFAIATVFCVVGILLDILGVWLLYRSVAKKDFSF